MIATIQQKLAYEQSEATRLESSLCLLSAFNRFGIPESFTDLGCGPGHLVQIADALGSRSIGVDIALNKQFIRLPNRSKIYQDNLIDMKSPDPAEMVVCWGVAEHLPESDVETLCDLIAKAAEGTLLFSAAAPGQGGSGNINEQPSQYWIDLFITRGFVYVWPLTEALRGEWAILAPNAQWYGQNLLVFRKVS